MKLPYREVAFWVVAAAPLSANALQAAGTAPAKAAPYDEFMRRPRAERAKRFNGLTAENKATLLNTHATRWLKKNRARLTPSQVGIVEEHIRFAYARFFAVPQDADVAAAFKDLAARTAETLTLEDSVAGLSVLGEYIPPDRP